MICLPTPFPYLNVSDFTTASQGFYSRPWASTPDIHDITIFQESACSTLRSSCRFSLHSLCSCCLLVREVPSLLLSHPPWWANTYSFLKIYIKGHLLQNHWLETTFPQNDSQVIIQDLPNISALDCDFLGNRNCLLIFIFSMSHIVLCTEYKHSVSPWYLQRLA